MFYSCIDAMLLDGVGLLLIWGRRGNGMVQEEEEEEEKKEEEEEEEKEEGFIQS